MNGLWSRLVANVRAGTRLFSEGDPGDAAYFVVTGRLRAFRAEGENETEVGEIGRGEMVGEMALLEHQLRRASVYAVRDSQLVRTALEDTARRTQEAVPLAARAAAVSGRPDRGRVLSSPAHRAVPDQPAPRTRPRGR